MKQYVTIDIGGTDIKYGIIDETGTLIFKSSMSTMAHEGGSFIIKRVVKIINELKEEYSVEGVGISTAGIINPNKGEVIYASDAIPDYMGINLKEVISKETHLPVEVQNDVNCFALCEKYKGNGKGCSHFITLTIGTGIGGAIYINNQLYYGNQYSAGEWGRMIVIDQKFEDVGSITGLIKLANEHLEKKSWTGKDIFDLYDSGDIDAKKIVDTFYRYLATGITNLTYIFNPEKVLIGGGISNRGSKFIHELITSIKTIMEPYFFDNIKIELAKYKNDSGLMGAFYHFMDMQGLNRKTDK